VVHATQEEEEEDILLYPRDCSSRKIMLTGKKLGYRVFTSRLFKETHIRHIQQIQG